MCFVCYHIRGYTLDMEVEWIYAIGAVGVVSAVSFAGVFALALRDAVLRRSIFMLVALAVGTLFGDALLHLLPEAFESDIGEIAVGAAAFLGIILFFVLEKLLAWHHSHGEHEESRDTLFSHAHAPRAVAPLVLTADFVHNAIDGVIIGASFLASIPVGIATTLAVVLHEIPQEIADFGILIHAGWSRGKALLWNFLSALSAFIGLFVVFLLGVRVEGLVSFAAAFTAGAFIYIAGTDLVPELHKTSGTRHTLAQTAAVIVGFVLMLLLTLAE